MKLGTAYYGFRDQTPLNYFEMAAALGLPYVEIPLYAHIIKDKYYNLRSVEAIDALRASAESVGLQIIASVSNLPVAKGVNLWGGTLDDSTVAFGLAAARRVIDIAAQLGLGVARITEPNIIPEHQANAETLLAACAIALRQLADYAAQKEVRLVVENYGITSSQLLYILDVADHPYIGALYDPCNFFRIGEDPLQGLKKLRERIYYVHLKDARRYDKRDPNMLFEGSRWAPSVAVGEGEIDWKPIFSELKQFYQGYLGSSRKLNTRKFKQTVVKCAQTIFPIRVTVQSVVQGSSLPFG